MPSTSSVSARFTAIETEEVIARWHEVVISIMANIARKVDRLGIVATTLESTPDENAIDTAVDPFHAAVYRAGFVATQELYEEAGGRAYLFAGGGQRRLELEMGQSQRGRTGGREVGWLQLRVSVVMVPGEVRPGALLNTLVLVVRAGPGGGLRHG